MAKKTVIAIALCLLVAVLPLVRADETTEAFTVFTERKEYLVGEAIDVYVRAEAIDPNETITVTDVVVYDPSGTIVAEWHNMSIVLPEVGTQKHVGTFLATSEGEYTVSASATGCLWILRALWRLICRYLRHVVPEVPIGTIAASATMMIGLGAYFAVPRWRRKRKS